MRTSKLEIKRLEELEQELEKYHDGELRLRLLFLRCLHQNFEDIEYACETFKIGLTRGYGWLHKWNEGGVELLKNHPITGRPSKLNDIQVQQLKEHLKGKNWELKEIKELIFNLFNIEMSITAVYNLLRNKIEMHYAKPYKKDYRRPKEAEEILENELQEKFALLDSYGIKPQEVAIGFLDEASPQNKANSARVWNLDKPEMEVNTQKFKANTIGFYAIEGQNVLDFLLDSKIESIKEFFKEIRKANDSYEYIIVILDNFKTHHACEVEKIAFDLGILVRP